MRSELELIPLQDQIKTSRPELLDRQIEEFCCAKDPDVESFLKKNAVNYERSGISRTYLYVINKEDDSDIVAYFSVGITATSFEGVSGSRKSKVLGGTPGRDSQDHFGGIIIGEVGRSDKYSGSDLSGREIIADAEEIIEQGRKFLGGKIVYLDCREPLIQFYEKNGYTKVVDSPYPSGFFKMFKTLPKI
jgi:predicted GNAT family N-acyltransferase